ncbi:MAG: FAD-binding oxidoreductase [Thermodesulfobacteriota bacterium]
MSDLKQLLKIVSEYEYPEPDTKKFNQAGFSPKLLLFPNTIEEISEAVKFCNISKIPLVPSGNSTKLFIGNPVSNGEVVISLRNMNKILEHEAADLVSTVECGLLLKKFQRLLGLKGQFLPIENPFADNATIGGIISANISGSLSSRYGTCRELLLGVRAVRADGKIIKGGAKVVKNVAGYDIPKLFVGAYGTLSVLVEATFRLYPREEYSETAVLVIKEYKDMQALFNKISRTDIVPSSFEILDKNLSARLLPKTSNSFCFLYRIESFEIAVKKQMKELELIAEGDVGEFFRISGRLEKTLWKNVNEFPFDHQSELTGRVSLPISSSFKLLEIIEEINKSMDVKIESLIRPERGLILFSIKGTANDTVNAANLVRTKAKSLKGTSSFTTVADELRDKVEIFGDFGSSYKVMKNLKEHFDPNNILNPGKVFN